MRKFLSETFIYSLSQQVPLVISFFLLPVLTPHLTPIDYGIHGVIMAYIGILDYLKDLGFISVLPKAFFDYKTKYKVIWNRLFGFLSLWSVVLAVLAGVILYFVIPREAVANRWPIILL